MNTKKPETPLHIFTWRLPMPRVEGSRFDIAIKELVAKCPMQQSIIFKSIFKKGFKP